MLTVESDRLAIAHVPAAKRMAAALVRGKPHLRDEAQSEALVELVIAARSYRDRGGRFSSYLYARLRVGLRGFAWSFPSCGTVGGDDATADVAAPPEGHDPGGRRAALSRAIARIKGDGGFVLRHRYGLAGRPVRSPRWIADRLGRAGAWVERAEAESIERLRGEIEGTEREAG